ncbi:MAG: hypothetical protein ACRDOC_08445 [Streptosporangiaceae bacterium]
MVVSARLAVAEELDPLDLQFRGAGLRLEQRDDLHKTLVHPELGPIELDCQVLFTEDQSQALLVLTAPPRTEGYEKLQLLAVLGQQRFTATGPAR